MPLRRSFALAAPLIFALAAALPLLGQGGSHGTKGGKAAKDKLDLDASTQAVPVEVDLPQAVTAETARLTFRVSPLSSKGLLLQQTRDALKAVEQAGHGARIVKLRAFVAGTGDARRVRGIVIDYFREKKQPLPALTTVQAGELAKEGAQVVLESIAEESGKRPANPDGLIFLPAWPADDAGHAVEQLALTATEAHASPADVLQVTCFLASSGDAAAAQAAAARVFPTAAREGSIDVVQRLRAPSGPAAACEAVARGKSVTAPKLVFTGAQMAFGDKESDLRLAFTRLQKTLEPFGANYQDVVFGGFYPTGRAAEQELVPLRTEFFHGPQPPLSTMVFEGLPSPDASISMDVVAAIKGDAVRN